MWSGVFAGWAALRTRHQSNQMSASAPVYWLVEGVTGVASALSGTGGPVVLVPIMLSLDASFPTAVGVGQVVQLPIGSVSTIANWCNGALDPLGSAPVAITLMPGSVVGSRLALRTSLPSLTKVQRLRLLCCEHRSDVEAVS